MKRNRCWRIFFALIFILLDLTSCSLGGSFQASSAGDGDPANRFTSVGIPLSLDSIASTIGITYNGRIFFADGANRYAGHVSFTITKHSESEAYFSNFTISNWGKFDSSLNSTVVDFSAGNPTVISGTQSYNKESNSLVITNANIRTAKINLTTANPLLTNKLNEIGILFANDIDTFAGGNSSFAIIAQKEKSISSVNDSNYTGSWFTTNIQSITGNVEIQQNLNLNIIEATGPNSLPRSFIGMFEDGTTFTGEGGIMNSKIGIFTFALHSIDANAFSVDGMFALSPDNKFILGFDINNGNFQNFILGNK